MSPKASNLNSPFRHSINERSKRPSIQNLHLSRKFTDFNRASVGQTHKRGISLFNRELTSVELPGNIAANIFQARQSSIISKEKEKRKSSIARA